jgi:asparagine synthase (glutamine-hydrolysing)
MCGIFGLFMRRPLSYADVAKARQASRMLAHRGPDGEGEWLERDAGVYLSHRRLAIIDPTPDSAQPMAQNGHVITYNGEIYNFPAVSADLKAKGLASKTSGDVEVLLNAWRFWKQDCLDRLDGMFAFIIWDGERGHVAVDPFGEKPLFIAEIDGGICVASEIDPIAQIFGLIPQLDRTQWCAYLSYGNLHAPETAFPSIRRLPPASYATVENGVVGTIRNYWRPPVDDEPRGDIRPVPESGLDDIAEALAESIRGRLLSDVPLALFLSAGVDSSLVASIAAKELNTELTCLSVAFPRGDSINEAPRARAIADYLKLPHSTLESDEDPSRAGVTQQVDILQQPHDNLSALAVHQLSATAAQKFKVCLTGMGGDELTFGYGKHDQLYRRRQFYGMPEPVRRIAGASLGAVPHLPGRLDNFRSNYLVRDSERYIALKDFPAIDGLRRLPGFSAWADREFSDLKDPVYLSIPRYELTDALPNDQLIVYDHASMRASLELRTPFLNRRLVDVIAGLDPRALLAFGQKSVLRRLLDRYLPRELHEFPKSGFRFPHDVFLNAAGRSTPRLPGLAEAPAEALWRRRFDGKGWTRIGVRLAVANEFFHRYDGIPG